MLFLTSTLLLHVLGILSTVVLHVLVDASKSVGCVTVTCVGDDGIPPMSNISNVPTLLLLLISMYLVGLSVVPV